MALASARALVGRHVLLRNAIKTFDNSPRIGFCISSKYSTVATVTAKDIENIIDHVEEKPKKKLSKAMQAYLQRAKEYDEFIQQEKKEYQIGRRHLANMMGEDPETFTQDDVNKAIEYLFPSGLYDRRARPVMTEPESIFHPRKAPQFDESGRPFHSMFYTLKPNYYESLYNIIEELNKLNEFEDEELRKGLLPNTANKANLISSEWMTKVDLEEIFLEFVSDRDYNAFINAADRLANHPYSENAIDFIMRYRKLKQVQTADLIIEPLQYDKQGRSYVIVKDCKRRDARGEVKLLGDGTGKITINGQDITYFNRQQDREQVSYFDCQ